MSESHAQRRRSGADEPAAAATPTTGNVGYSDIGAPHNTAKKLLDVRDQLDRVFHLLEAASMAAGELTVEFQGPVKAVIGAAYNELNEAHDSLDSVCLQLGEGAVAARDAAA
jgi:hypothetical protein